jgi:DNA ligase-4
MTVAFKKPFVAEVLGSGFERLQNESFEMLRHPRVKKLHHDRTWEDCVTMEELDRMAREKWNAPNADKLDGHAKDVALLVKKYVQETGGSQGTMAIDDTTQDMTQQTTPCTTQETTSTTTPQTLCARIPQLHAATVQETQEYTDTTVSSTQSSGDGSTQGKGVRASRELRFLVREDTSERLASTALLDPTSPSLLTSPGFATAVTSITMKHNLAEHISPPSVKRRRVLRPLSSLRENRNLGTFEYDSQEATIHIYAREGVKVQVHTSSMEQGLRPSFS